MTGVMHNTISAWSRPTDWRTSAVLTAVALIAIGLVHHEAWLSMTRIWTVSETYTHGWLIIPFSAWLVWRQRRTLAGMRPRVWWPALAAIAALEMLWVAADIAGVQGAQHFVIVALIPVTVLLLTGPRVAWVLAFPLAYLVFAIPWGEGLVPVLQDVTAWMAVELLELTGVPVYWEGRLISIPVGDFEVAEACAGVRYLIAALALGTLFAYLVYESVWRRLAFIVASAAVPIVANGIRAWGIIMLASLSDMRLAVGVDHLIYGWVFFGFVMFLLFWLGSLWREPEPAAGATSAGAAAADRFEPQVAGPVAGSTGAAVTVVLLVVAASMVPDWSARLQPTPATAVALPAGADGWHGRRADPDGWYAGFAGADDVQLRHYRARDKGESVGVLVIHYRREIQGKELVSSGNRLRAEDWNWLGAGHRRLEAGNTVRAVRELRVRRGGQNRLIWFWYDIGGWQTTSPALAKGFAALNRLTGQPGDATLVAIAGGYTLQPDEARSRLQSFVADHPQLLAPRGVVEKQ